MADGLSSSMFEFLSWVAAHRRSYDEAAEAWRSTCPRHTVWEDAFIDGLVRLQTDGAGECTVTLTLRGEAAFRNASASCGSSSAQGASRADLDSRHVSMS